MTEYFGGTLRTDTEGSVIAFGAGAQTFWNSEEETKKEHRHPE